MQCYVQLYWVKAISCDLMAWRIILFFLFKTNNMPFTNLPCIVLRACPETFVKFFRWSCKKYPGLGDNSQVERLKSLLRQKGFHQIAKSMTQTKQGKLSVVVVKFNVKQLARKISLTNTVIISKPIKQTFWYQFSSILSQQLKFSFIQINSVFII